MYSSAEQVGDNSSGEVQGQVSPGVPHMRLFGSFKDSDKAGHQAYVNRIGHLNISQIFLAGEGMKKENSLSKDIDKRKDRDRAGSASSSMIPQKKINKTTRIIIVVSMRGTKKSLKSIPVEVTLGKPCLVDFYFCFHYYHAMLDNDVPDVVRITLQTVGSSLLGKKNHRNFGFVHLTMQDILQCPLKHTELKLSAKPNLKTNPNTNPNTNNNNNPTIMNVNNNINTAATTTSGSCGSSATSAVATAVTGTNSNDASGIFGKFGAGEFPDIEDGSGTDIADEIVDTCPSSRIVIGCVSYPEDVETPEDAMEWEHPESICNINNNNNNSEKNNKFSTDIQKLEGDMSSLAHRISQISGYKVNKREKGFKKITTKKFTQLTQKFGNMRKNIAEDGVEEEELPSGFLEMDYETSESSSDIFVLSGEEGAAEEEVNISSSGGGIGAAVAKSAPGGETFNDSDNNEVILKKSFSPVPGVFSPSPPSTFSTDSLPRSPSLSTLNSATASSSFHLVESSATHFLLVDTLKKLGRRFVEMLTDTSVGVGETMNQGVHGVFGRNDMRLVSTRGENDVRAVLKELFVRFQTSPDIQIHIGIVGSDHYVSTVLRPYFQFLANWPRLKNPFLFYLLPLGKNINLAKYVGSMDSEYSSLFLSSSVWYDLFCIKTTDIDKLLPDSDIFDQIEHNILQYFEHGTEHINISLGEVLVTHTDADSLPIPIIEGMYILPECEGESCTCQLDYWKPSIKKGTEKKEKKPDHVSSKTSFSKIFINRLPSCTGPSKPCILEFLQVFVQLRAKTRPKNVLTRIGTKIKEKKKESQEKKRDERNERNVDEKVTEKGAKDKKKDSQDRKRDDEKTTERKFDEKDEKEKEKELVHRKERQPLRTNVLRLVCASTGECVSFRVVIDGFELKDVKFVSVSPEWSGPVKFFGIRIFQSYV